MNNEFDSYGEDYEDLLNRFNILLKKNKKIFFSGSFGEGKTTFLEKWEEKFCTKKIKKSGRKWVDIDGEKFELIKINAFSEFYSESFIEIMEQKIFSSIFLYLTQYWLLLIITIINIIIMILELRGSLNIKTSNIDILASITALASLFLAFNQYNRNLILENRSKRIKKKCSKKNYIFLIDDFDRLNSLVETESNSLERVDKQKENILKTCSLIESDKTRIIFVGDIKKNNMNFLEKYYDYIYEFPNLWVCISVKKKFINKWEEIIGKRNNKKDIDLFEKFSSYFLYNEESISIREIIRLDQHISSIDISRLNVSEVIISHYLFHIHLGEYYNVFSILRKMKYDFMKTEMYIEKIKNIAFKNKSNEEDEKLKSLIYFWLDVTKSNKLHGIAPIGYRMEFETCRENCSIYYVNQYDSIEFTYEEFVKKINDLNFWLKCNSVGFLNHENNNTRLNYNLNRFYEKLKNKGMHTQSVRLLLNNVYKLRNIDEVRGLISNINYMTNWDNSQSYTEQYDYLENIVDFDADKQGKTIYLIHILNYNKLTKETEELYIQTLSDWLKELHDKSDTYICSGWLSMLFYTSYAKYVDQETSLIFWKEKVEIADFISKYYYEGDKLALGYFFIGIDEYDRIVEERLVRIEGVAEAVDLLEKHNSGALL